MLYLVTIKYQNGSQKRYNKVFKTAKSRFQYRENKLSNPKILSITIQQDNQKVKSNRRAYNVNLEEQIVSKKKQIMFAVCIYALIKDNKVVYIGQSEQPMGRIQSHINSTKIFDSYAVVEWLSVGNKRIIDQREKEYIKALRPIYNITHNK